MNLTATISAQENLVLPLAQNATGASLRIASTSTGVLGTLTASGTNNAAWSISQNPSWITITPDPTNPLMVTLAFANSVAQANPYQFYITCTGSSGTLYYPISLEVREPLSIASEDGSTSFSIPSNDSTVPDIVIQGIGLDGVVDTGVKFIQPIVVPPGLNIVTSDESSLILRVQPASETNISGGLTMNTGSPISTQLTLQAYKPGTMYDTPERCCTQVFTVESLTRKSGTIDAALALNFNTANNTFRADAYVDFLEGAASSVTYEWDIVPSGGAAGSISSGGGSADKFVIWTPSADGFVSFTFKVMQNGVVISQDTVANVPVSAQVEWTSTAAVKLSVGGPVSTGYVGTSPLFTVSTPASEFNSGETITVTLSVTGGSVIEGNATLNETTLVLTAGNNSQTASLLIPPSGINEKWNVTLSAANAVSSPTRTGVAQLVVESNGLPGIDVEITGGPSFTAVTGVGITPIAVTTGGVATALQLQGAPDGLLIEGSSVVGTLLTPGTYTFNVLAHANGYATSMSAAVTLTVTQALAPLTIGSFSPSVASIPDGQPFNVQWSLSGSFTEINLFQNYIEQGVTGSTLVTLTEIGNSVMALVGTSFYGNAYTIPIIVLSSSITGQGRLLNAPTQGVIDENFNLTLSWQPPSVRGGYSIYKGWNILLTKVPGGTPQLQSLSTGIPTGLEIPGTTVDSRAFSTVLQSGDYTVTMEALSADYTQALDASYWDAAHQFPTQITDASVTFNQSTLDIGQVLGISLDPAYVGANSWRINFSDNTSTGWQPLSIKTVNKLFTVPGVQNIVIQTKNDFTSSNPSVILIRQVIKTIFVANQQYIAPNSTVNTGGAEGFGGESGFEITDDINGGSSTQPFMTVVRTLVRDTTTNELRLFIATSRNADASSLLGTMALDVFPIAGRPKVLDLIEIPEVLATDGVASTSPVSISAVTLPNFIVGKVNSDFDLQTVANTGTAPFSWYTNGLPSGLSLSIDGTLSGTPQEIFNGTVNFSVIDSSNPPFIADISLPLSVVSDLAILTRTIPGPVVTTPYSFPIVSSGGLAPYTWSVVSGNLPQGLALDPNTGIVSGTPVTYNSTSDFAKVYTATIQVVDSIGAIATIVISTTLSPAPLQFGNLNQPNIFASSSYRMSVPVFGGTSPYVLSSFTDDGIVGSGLSIINPTKVHVVAGLPSSGLTIATPNQFIYPQSYPVGVEVNLTALNGVAPYRFLVSSSSNNTLPGIAIYGDTLVGFPTADGVYTANVECIDAVGHIVTNTIQIAVQQKNVGVYTVNPVSVALNGSTNPANWTITELSALPDAAAGTAYVPMAGSLYGLALYQNNVLHITQNSGTSNPISFAIRSGTLPANITAASANGFGASTDYSGLVLFNAFGGAYPSTKGSSSFEVEFSNIETTSGNIVEAVARESITVVSTVGTTTPVVVLDIVPEITLNQAAVSGSAYAWFLPLVAEGGTGPYNFSIRSNSTLPGATIASQNGVSVLTANSLALGTYTVYLKATDANGVQTAAFTLQVKVVQAQTQATHIVSSNLPSSIYENLPLVPNTYFVQADAVSTWSANGLPTGMTISSNSGTYGYLQGTPTQVGTFTVVVTAISVLYGTPATHSYTLTVTAQAASIIHKPTTATVGVLYSVVNNNAILTVQYTGYQPDSPSLPTLTSLSGIVGTPGVLLNGLPTTAIRSVTPDGFTMDYNYSNSTAGIDVITLGSGLDNCSITVSQPALIVSPSTVSATVSEYATSATFSAPVMVSGGLAPYTIVCNAFSDSRFSAQGSGIAIDPSQFQAGSTYPCLVQVTAVDSSGQSVTAAGTLQITIRQETYDTIDFSNPTWAVNVSAAAPFTASIEPNLQGSVPVLGHAPYQYYVDNVLLPPALAGFVTVSPSRRVLAIQCNNTNTSAVVADVGPTLGAFGTFVVPAVSFSSAPPPGTYQISATLRVVDSNSIATSQAVTIFLTIS